MANYKTEDFKNVLDLYAGITGESTKTSVPEPLKVSYNIVNEDNRNAILDDNQFKSYMNKSNDEFIGELLYEPMSKHTMNLRNLLSRSFMVRDRKMNEKKNHNDENHNLEVINCEKALISAENLRDRIIFVQSLNNALERAKSHTKQEERGFYGELKWKEKKLKEASEKIIQPFFKV